MDAERAITAIQAICSSAFYRSPKEISLDLESFVTKSGAESLVQALLRRDARVRNLVESPFEHENGFLKVIVHEDRDADTRVRLHVWDTRRRKTGIESDIHNHTRDFASVVLTGNLVSRRFIVDATATSPAYFSYRATNRLLDRSYAFEPGPRLHLRMTDAEQVSVRTTHYDNFDALHQIFVAPRQLVATLFIQGPVKQQTTTVCALRRKHQLLSKSRPSSSKKLTHVLTQLAIHLDEKT
jgi:hypothetical protein